MMTSVWDVQLVFYIQCVDYIYIRYTIIIETKAELIYKNILLTQYKHDPKVMTSSSSSSSCASSSTTTTTTTGATVAIKKEKDYGISTSGGENSGSTSSNKKSTVSFTSTAPTAGQDLVGE